MRQTRDEKIEVGLVVVLNPKVIDDENKDNGTGDMTKETGGGGFIKPVLFEEADDALVAQFSRLLKTVHGLLDPEKNISFSGSIDLDKGEKGKAREDCRGISVNIDLKELRGWESSVKIKISEVDCAKEGRGRDDRVKQDVNGGEGSDVLGGRAGG